MMQYDKSIHECQQFKPTQVSNVRNKFLDFTIMRALYHRETGMYTNAQQTLQFTFYPTALSLQRGGI